MSLKFLGAVDMYAYIEAVKAAKSFVDFQPASVGGSAGNINRYVQKFDQMVLPCTSTGGLGRRLYALDPMLQNTSNAIRATQADSVQSGQVIPGFYDQIAGTQTVYMQSGSGALGIVDTFINCTYSTLTEGSAAFGGGKHINRNASPQDNAGEWRGGPEITSFVGGDGSAHIAIFEGLKDGIAGETLLTGTNVYPNGLMLLKCDEAQIGAPIDSGADGASDHAFCWVDLATDNVVGRMADLPGRTSTATAPFTEALIAGQAFHWRVKQFVPDSDSTPLFPKGELVLMSTETDKPANPTLFTQSVFVRVLDFNPRNKVASAGAPSRIHKRITLTSSMDFNIAPLYDVGGAITPSTFPTEAIAAAFYHPPTRRFCLPLCIYTNESLGTNATGEAFMGYWARQVEPSNVTNPVPRSFPRTNAVNPYEATVMGNLGEIISGQNVAWTLQRLDTQGEVLTGTFTPASTSTVANAPIDQKFPTATEGSLVVYANGVPLVQGTNYTVVLSTGVITWVTNHSGQTVTADYVHRQTAASPPHGTLLTAASTSGADGRVFTDVKYADDNALVGKIDLLTVVAS